MLRFRIYRYIWIAFILMSAIAVSAQSQSCDAILQTALDSMLRDCERIYPDEACYGYGSVSISPELSVFRSPGNRIGLISISRIETSAVDTGSSSAGVALLRLGNAYIIMYGDAWIEWEDNTVFNVFNFETGDASDECGQKAPAIGIYVPDTGGLNLTVNGVELYIQGYVTVQYLNANNTRFAVHNGVLEILDGETGVVGRGQSISAVASAGTFYLWSLPTGISRGEEATGSLMLDIMVSLGGVLIESSPSCGTSIHIVSRGENLYRIGLHYGVTIESIMEANGLTDRNAISVDQELVIPCSEGQAQGGDVDLNSDAPYIPPGQCGPNTIHVISRGETIYQIALAYGTTSDAIIEANNITDVTRIHAGNQLRVPCADFVPDSTAGNNTPAPGINLFCVQFFSSAPSGGYDQAAIDRYNRECL